MHTKILDHGPLFGGHTHYFINHTQISTPSPPSQKKPSSSNYWTIAAIIMAGIHWCHTPIYAMKAAFWVIATESGSPGIISPVNSKLLHFIDAVVEREIIYLCLVAPIAF